MKKIVLISALILFPAITCASTASDFIVNRQSTYAVPYNAQNILVLDLTLPAPAEGEILQLTSISLHNTGTADHTNIAKLTIWEDGAASGWDGDERLVVVVNSAPFFDTAIPGDFRKYSKGDAWQRIFVTIDTNETGNVERSFQLQLIKNSVVFASSSATGPTDTEVTGFERKMVFGDSFLAVPSSPIAGVPEAISSNIIRWYFTDIANNEFGFKLLDSNSKVLVKKEEANLIYIDETGLQPDTEYSGRKIVAFNDRGENPVSVSSVFPSARTLALAPVVVPVSTTTEVKTEEPKEEIKAINQEIATSTLFETIQTKIADIQKEISNLIKQLDEFIKLSAATVFGALQGFLQAFFGK